MNPILRTASIAALALAIPVSASAADFGPSPIVLTLADVQPQIQGAELETPGLVRVEFHNTAKLAATRVTFEVSAWGVPVARIADVGTFVPGATVDHVFPSSSGVANETISVASVQFSDGSVWQSGAITPQSRLQAVSQLDRR